MMSTQSHDRGWPAAIVVIGVFFAALAPTLDWLEFSNGSEGLVVATALEIRRDGSWLIPKLQGQTRLEKPPLAAWITAAGMRASTLSQLHSPDAAVRDHAFRALSSQVRLMALLATCIALAATFAMARSVCGGNSPIPLVSLLVAGSMLLLLRFCRYATTDVYMLMWVALAGASLASGIFQQRWWRAWIGAGATLGFAILTKGPVAIALVLIPAVLFALAGPGARKRLHLPTMLVGLIVMLAIALPWFALVGMRQPGAWHVWIGELSRIEATRARPDAWYKHFGFVLQSTPWIVYLVTGLIGALVATIRRDRPALFFAATMLVVPLVILSFLPDRVPRYTLPLVPAAAMLCAIALVDGAQTRLGRIIAGAHWTILACLAAGLPLAGAGLAGALVRYDDGSPWFTWSFAVATGGVLLAVIVVGLVRSQGAARALVVATFVVMLALQAVFVRGYATSREGRAETRPLAEAIASAYPDAVVYNAHPDGKIPPTDLVVYLARTAPPISDPTQLRPTSKPQILLMVQREGTPPPTAPAGWEHFGKAPRDTDWWHGFVRLPG